MSGHSKWSKVKHQKAVTDVAKSAAFTRASRAITISVKEGGGVTDPNFNFRLRLAIEKARSVNMPKDNIERAIQKANAESGSILEETYEGYGPYGIAFFIETATDNANRTVSTIKQFLEHAGGSMASPGAVSYLFDRRGVITVPLTVSSDTVFENALEAGADDVVTYDDCYELYTHPEKLFQVRKALEEKGIPVSSFALVMEAKVPISLSPEKNDQVDRLIEKLEEVDDIQRVFTNKERLP